MTRQKCEMILNKIYARMESGEITPIEQNAAVSSLENQNPEFTESIIDDQLKRLQDMKEKGNITKEDYDKQVSVWLSKRELYEKNTKEAERRAREEQKKEDKKIGNRVKKFMIGNNNKLLPATESCMDFWNAIFK